MDDKAGNAPWYILQGKGANTREPIPELPSMRDRRTFGGVKNYWIDCPEGKDCTFKTECMYVHHVKVGSYDYKRFYNHKASERWVKMMVTREENEERTPGLRKD